MQLGLRYCESEMIYMSPCFVYNPGELPIFPDLLQLNSLFLDIGDTIPQGMIGMGQFLFITHFRMYRWWIYTCPSTPVCATPCSIQCIVQLCNTGSSRWIAPQGSIPAPWGVQNRVQAPKIHFPTMKGHFLNTSVCCYIKNHIFRGFYVLEHGDCS